ncbi:putative toxin-antitoxin system toxin component, PIN family [Sporosarcina sp. OR05]|uniref:putative toxin-antitoxin system toxin component, PIN family n=1 Tax=Sporosarcina sp. OR05 TaxID=2969819 RepID=UPI00352B86BF
MIKVVFDTNVIIDGLLGHRSDCEEIIDCFNAGIFRAAFSQETIGELMYITKKIANQELQLEEEKIAFLLYIADMFFYYKSVNTLKIRGNLEVYCNDKFDDMFLECSYAGHVHYLVTNDTKSGLLDINCYEFKIVPSIEFLEQIKGYKHPQ